jgi:glycosyltransferase involved in cell wall biosynthesis
VGRFEVEKGIELLLDAAISARKHAEFGLAFVGYGSLAERIAEAASRYPWIELKGQLPQDRVMAELAASDALVCPSIWPENFPGVVVQSLVAGRPVLASYNGGIPELVRDGENGLLFSTENSTQLRESIIEFSTSAEVRARLSAGARAWAERYDPSRPVRRLSRILKRLSHPNPRIEVSNK